MKTSRTYPIFLLIGCMILGSSCSDDGEDITGSYRITSVESSECPDPEENIIFDFSSNGGCNIQFGTEICGMGTLNLSADNTFQLSLTISEDGDPMTLSSSGTYELEGNTFTICDSGACESATIDLGSSRIAIRYPDESCVVTIRGEK